ncbi:MAG: TfoX/Sxy family DNA transformation protein [Betaproteobacteria bacterium]|nr:TfoX/Sxy family DNA transformation protein [Betaproteobacteria bacterium]
MNTSTAVTPTPIEKTPGIGPNLAGELRSVGIDTLEALTKVGFWDAWQQLRRANPERDCLPSCLALAGAVAGVRWNHLPPKVRADIRQRVKAARA